MLQIALPTRSRSSRFEHALRAADQATIDELADPGLADHNPAPGHEPTLAGFKQKVADFKTVFPDPEEDLQDIIASGDIVATRRVVTGTPAAGVHGDPRGSPGHGAEGIRLESSVTQPPTAEASSEPSIAGVSDHTREGASRQPAGAASCRGACAGSGSHHGVAGSGRDNCCACQLGIDRAR